MWKQGFVEGLITLLVCGLVTTVLIKRKWGNRDERRFPPGPFAWPIIGHLHLLTNLPHQTLRDLSKQYGPVVGLRFGQHRAVVVSSPELAKEVLLTQDQVFADRPPLDFTSTVLYGLKNDLTFGSYGPEWRKQRKICTLGLFTAKRLRDLEYVRQEEIRSLLQRIHEESGGGMTAVDCGRCVGQMSSTLVTRLLLSKAVIEVEGHNLQDLIKEVERQATYPTVGDVIPWLSWLDFPRKRQMHRLHARLDKVYTAMLVGRKLESASSHHDDLVHHLLSSQEAVSEDEIKSMLHNMIAAGVHATALTLEWAMAEVLRNPRCYQRLQTEIDTILGGKKKQIDDADVLKLSYLQCVVKEVFRLHPVVPLLLPHISMEECKVHGYTLPAGTRMFVNVWAIGRDERVWPNAVEFMPERFEGKDTDLKGQHFELLPFGSGRRICLGLHTGLSIVQVTLANLVKYFDWELPCKELHTSINMDEKTGLTNNKATPVIAIPKPRVSVDMSLTTI